MRFTMLPIITMVSLLSCRKEDVQLRVKLSAYYKRCAIEYYDSNGVVHRDTMYGKLEYTWIGGSAIVDTVPGWTAGWHIVLSEDDEPRISACSLEQDSSIITLKAEGDIPTRTVTAYVGCAYMP